MAWLLPLAMLAALLVDRAFGKLPFWALPVGLMRRWLATVKLTNLRHEAGSIGGALVWALGALGTAALTVAVETALIHGLKPWSGWLQLLAAASALGLLLKPLLSWHRVADQAPAEEEALQGSLGKSREQLSNRVSGDTPAMTETEVAEAAIARLARNLNHAVVAPLFWFAIAGLPGAAVYRFANTADALWRHAEGCENCAKWATRADDMLSWLPARLTSLALRLGPYRHNHAGATPGPAHLAAVRTVAMQALVIATLMVAALAWAIRS